MQALEYLGPSTLEWRQTPSPSIQGEAEALVRPLAVAACDLDLEIVSGRSPFQPPFVLGHEFAGEVMAVGEGVAGFVPGDRVAVSFQPSCGQCPACHWGCSAACGSVGHTAMYGIGAAGGDWGGALAGLVRIPYASSMLVKLPAGVTPAAAAGASDNVADGYRCVAEPLEAQPGASVLVAGQGSIALYAVYWALRLGASRVTLCSRDGELGRRAAALGAEAETVTAWPRRFRTHAVTVDCTGEAAGLAAVIRSTEAFGTSTSASIYFGGDPAVPMLEMYMKGITFRTGRVCSASLLPDVLDLMARHRLTPEQVEATVVGWDYMGEALKEGAFRPIAVR